MNLKKIGYLILILSFICVTTSCGKNDVSNSNDKTELTDSDIFEQKALALIDIIDERAIKDNYQNTYNVYKLESSRLIGKNFNNKLWEYDYNLDEILTDYDSYSGLVIENVFGQYYISVKNDKYCLLKNFDTDIFEIHDVENEEKCHLSIADNGKIELIFFNYVPELNQVYESGTVINTKLRLTIVNNLYDSPGYIYKWYRNGIEITGENDFEYIIDKNEDAEYYAEMIINDGTVIKTDTIHVIIQK